jgi:flagellar biogenesis protein FliO
MKKGTVSIMKGNAEIAHDAGQGGIRWREVWQWASPLLRRILRQTRRAPRSLRLRESLSLGDRRFVAVVEFEQSRFLVGGTSTSVVLLAALENAGRNQSSSDSNAIHTPSPVPAEKQW